MSRRVLVALGLVLAMFVAACDDQAATSEPTHIQIAGSTSMGPLATELADAYNQHAPAVGLRVRALGTQLGLEALRDGSADVALASWLPADVRDQWRATLVDFDGIAVIVHPSNAVQGLGLLQLRDLFAGRNYEWEAVGVQAGGGQVQPVSREEGSGTRAAFEWLVMVDDQMSRMAVVVPSSEAVVEYVAAHPQAIGYVSLGYVTPKVKVLAIEGELPSAANAEQGVYPITREFWLVTADRPSAEVEGFLQFVVGPLGQEVVEGQDGRVR